MSHVLSQYAFFDAPPFNTQNKYTVYNYALISSGCFCVGILHEGTTMKVKKLKAKCASDQEKLLKFQAEGREFSKFLRTIYQTVIVQTNFLNKILV